MKEKLLLLIRLQECDLQLVKLSSKKVKLPGKINKMEEDFRLFKENVEINKRKYEELKARRAEFESKIKKLQDGMIKTKERLLEVKNNKEYQAMLKEIETAEKTCGDLENQVIALIDEMDKLAVLVKQDDDTLKDAFAEHEKEKKIVQDDLNAVDADTADWTEKRVGLQKQIPTDILDRYEKVRKRSNGVGVISVWKAVCNGCHMNIPPQLYNELQRSNELLSCPNCHRIMYFQDQEKSAQPFMENIPVKLFSDGACRGNPGIGGAGAVITDQTDQVLWEGKDYLGHCTNNIAEYKALILGLKGALSQGFKQLDVYLDSELLAKQINGSYKVKNEHLKILMQEVRGLMALFESVRVRHVLRCHNARADKLANLAIDERKGQSR